MRRRKPIDVLVIGGGQAGLAMSYELTRASIDHLVLDAGRSVGSAWRARWDSLRLFTPAAFSSLPGLPFPAASDHLPSRTDVAVYLDAYARAHGLPVALDEPVRELRVTAGGEFVARTDYACYGARQVVVATGAFQQARVPLIAATVPSSVQQLHSSEYRNPEKIEPGPVIVVGGGNSGVQIAEELAATRDVALVTGAPSWHLPERIFGRSIFCWLDALGLMSVSVTSRAGKRASRREMLIGRTPEDLARQHGVRLHQRAIRVEQGGLRTGDGALVHGRAVIWATGYRPSYDWVKADVFDGAGTPMHLRGVTGVPGLYFLGLPWQHTRGSALLGWVARDAEFVRSRIAARFSKGGTTQPMNVERVGARAAQPSGSRHS